MLQCLPRREAGAPRGGLIVKLHTTYRRRRGQEHPQPFHQLTVPIDIAEQLPEDARFGVTFDGDRVVYELLGQAPSRGRSEAS